MFPAGSAADEEWWVDRFRRAAREAWGAQRASAIDRALRRTALAVWRLMLIEFEPSEPPALGPEPFRDAPGGANQTGKAP